MSGPSKLILTPKSCFPTPVKDSCTYGSLNKSGRLSSCANATRKCTNMSASKITYNNLMTEPRVRRGSYIMHLPCKNAVTADSAITYASCFEMIKKDPLCQLYLRGLKKCGKKVKRSQASLEEAQQRIKKLSKDPQELANQQALLQRVIDNSSSCQTDELIEVFENELERIETCMQTEPIKDTDVTLLGLERQYPKKTGEDQDTQIEEGDLWSFKHIVGEVVVDLGLAVINQALLELMQENELDALRKQQTLYQAKKRGETDRLMEWVSREQELEEERSRLEKQEVEKYRKDRLTYFADNCLECDSEAEEQEAKDKEIAKENHIAEISTVVSDFTEEASKKVTLDNVSRELMDDIILQAALDRIFYGLEEGL